MLPKADIIYLPFKLLQFAGESIQKNLTICTIVNTIIIVSCFTLGLLEPILNYQGPETWAGALEIASPSHQWLTKMLIYKLYRKKFRKLFSNLDDFWPLSHEGKNMEAKLINMYSHVGTGFKTFFYCSAVATLLMCLKPLLTAILSEKNGRQLPVVMYNFIDLTQSPIYEITYAYHCVYLYLILAFVVGFDGLFLALCVNAVGQLKMLKHALTYLKIENTKHGKQNEYVGHLVRHHVFILEFLKEIRRIYSLLLLNQFFSSILCVCMAIYLTLNKGLSDLIFMVRCGMFALAGILQIFIYCITGTQVKSQMDSVAEAIYKCDWWKGERIVKLAVILVTQRSQMTNTIKAGGMIDLDLQSFISILKMSFSFYTIMQSANTKQGITH